MGNCILHGVFSLAGTFLFVGRISTSNLPALLCRLLPRIGTWLRSHSRYPIQYYYAATYVAGAALFFCCFRWYTFPSIRKSSSSSIIVKRRIIPEVNLYFKQNPPHLIARRPITAHRLRTLSCQTWSPNPSQLRQQTAPRSVLTVPARVIEAERSAKRREANGKSEYVACRWTCLPLSSIYGSR